MTCRNHDLIIRAFFQISQAACELPFVSLREGERQTLGGHIFREGPLLVDEVVRALRHQGALFSDAPVSAARLAALQAEADAFRLLRDQLEGLHRRACDSFVKAQARAISTALSLLGAAQEAHLARPPAAARGIAQQKALLSAALIFHAARRRNGRRAARRQEDAHPRQSGRRTRQRARLAISDMFSDALRRLNEEAEREKDLGTAHGGSAADDMDGARTAPAPSVEDLLFP